MIAKPSAKLLLGDAQRRVRVDRVVGDHRVQAVLAEELADRLHLVRRAVERRQRRPRVAAADEVQDPEQARGCGARPTDGCLAARASWCRRMTAPIRCACSIRPSSSYTLIVASAAAQRIGWRGRSARRRTFRVEVRRRWVAHGDRAERQVGRGQALGHRHEVGRDAPMVDGEPLAGAPKPAMTSSATIRMP